MFVSLHKTVPIKQQFLADRKYLNYTSYLFILMYSSVLLLIPLHYFLTDFVLRYHYKLCSSLINVFKFVIFFQTSNQEGPHFTDFIFPFQLTLNKYFPIYFSMKPTVELVSKFILVQKSTCFG